MTVNKILKNSSLYTFCALLQKGTGFLLLPIYTTYLKPEDYGIMNLITSITGFLSILFLVSLHAAAARFHFKYVTSKGQAIVWGTILLMVLFNSAFWGLICIISMMPFWFLWQKEYLLSFVASCHIRDNA